MSKFESVDDDIVILVGGYKFSFSSITGSSSLSVPFFIKSFFNFFVGGGMKFILLCENVEEGSSEGA